jgi:hypothetical protein
MASGISISRAAEAARESIEREERILRAAVTLVSAGNSRRVTVQGLHHARVVLPGIRREAHAAGVSLLIGPTESLGVCVTVERDGGVVAPGD